jgi:hypothetical protein
MLSTLLQFIAYCHIAIESQSMGKLKPAQLFYGGTASAKSRIKI